MFFALIWSMESEKNPPAAGLSFHSDITISYGFWTLPSFDFFRAFGAKNTNHTHNNNLWTKAYRLHY